MEIRFTEATIRDLRPPKDKAQETYVDTRYPGLKLKVGKKKKSWAVRQTERTAAGRRPYTTIGHWPTLTVRAAVKKSGNPEDGEPKDIMELIAWHEAELAALRRQANLLSFEALVEQYRERRLSQLKDPLHNYKILQRDPLRVWTGRPAEEIERDDVLALLDEIKARNAPVAANRCLTVIKALYNWALKAQLVKANPAAGIDPPSVEHERERWLDAREIREYFLAIEADEKIRPAEKDALRLCLLTGQRRNEVTGIEWSEIERDEAGRSWWNLPASKAKAKRPNRIYLAPQALEVFDRQRGASETYVFHRKTSTAAPMRPDDLTESLKPVTDRLLESKTIGSRATVHDLRRTANTHWASLGVPRRFQKMMLNHGSRQVTDRYDRYEYADELAQHWTTWADRLDTILAPDPTIEAPSA